MSQEERDNGARSRNRSLKVQDPASTARPRGRRRMEHPAYPGLGAIPRDERQMEEHMSTDDKTVAPQGPEPGLVLVVDDEATLADAVAMLVEDAGYAALVAYTGQQGLELARARRPALIITDMMMPRLSGAEMIAALRAEAQRDSVTMPPVILMTAGGVANAAAAGADVVVAKPFDIDRMQDLLQHYLGPRDP